MALTVAYRTLSGVHRIVSGAQAEHIANWTLSGFSGKRSAITHRTVRCAPDMSGEHGCLRATVDYDEQ
jgi:hypothetical protein